MPPYGAIIPLPDMPLSEGSLPFKEQHFCDVGGYTAFITNQTQNSLHRGDKLILYTMVQNIDGKPRVIINRRKVMPDEMTKTSDVLTRIGSEFADETKGWAMKHMRDEHCSTQTAVTRYTYYEQFATEEALQRATVD